MMFGFMGGGDFKNSRAVGSLVNLSSLTQYFELRLRRIAFEKLPPLKGIF